MTEKETFDILTYLKGTAPGFFIVPSAATKSWHKRLYKYDKGEVIAACDDIVASSNVPAISSIVAHCDRVRYQREQVEKSKKGYELKRASDESFRNVPGKNRAEQALFVCAERAAHHWINGERDNEFFNDRLLDGAEVGFRFDGVDYKTLRRSKNETSAGFRAFLNNAGSGSF